jgi:hypothetical protein
MTELGTESIDGSRANCAVRNPRCVGSKRVDRAMPRSLGCGGGGLNHFIVVGQVGHGF